MFEISLGVLLSMNQKAAVKRPGVLHGSSGVPMNLCLMNNIARS